MARLTSKQRNALPSSAFAEPKARKYPLNDASHAANAKARASQQVNKGRMSRAEESRLDAKADRVIARMSKPKSPR